MVRSTLTPVLLLALFLAPVPAASGIVSTGAGLPSDGSFTLAAKCPGCKVLAKNKACYPHLGKCVFTAKVFDPAKDVVTGVVLDPVTLAAQPYDNKALKGLDLAQKYLATGPVDDDLQAALDAAGPTDVLPIVVWLRTVGADPVREALVADPVLAGQVAQAELAANVNVQAEFKKGVAGAVAFAPVGYFNAPAVWTQATKAEVMYLSSLEAVAALYLWQPSTPLATDAWYSTINAGCATCNYATSQPVCIIEKNRPDDVSTLSLIDFLNDPPNGSTDAHARWVTGFLRSTTSPGGGAASASTDYLANYYDLYGNNSGPAMNWCASSGARVWNFSQTGSAAEDRLFDYWTRVSPYPVIAAAAGDSGSAAVVDNKGYNVLSVGGSNDQGDSDRSNDVLWPSSSSKNPTTPNNDRELPLLVAPAYNVISAGYVNSGTSGAAPQVAAAAAQLHVVNTGLRSWPEAIRAILMCSADENVDGGVLNLGDGTDDRDGAGELNLAIATSLASASNKVDGGNTAVQQGFDYGTMDFANDFAAGYYRETYNVKYPLSNMRIRAVLTWDAKATCTSGSDPSSCTSDTLDADLDLRVYDSNWTLVAYSTSSDNNYELVEFAATANMTYHIRVFAYSHANPTTYFSLAFNTWVYGS